MSTEKGTSIEEQEVLVPAGTHAKVISAIAAGLVAGVFLGIIFSSEDLLGQIAVIYGFRNTATEIGWAAHLAHSVLFALIFAAFLSITAVERSINRIGQRLSGSIAAYLPAVIGSRLPSSTAMTILLVGGLYGTILWVVVFGGIFFELLVARAGFGFMSRIGGLMSLPTLILHLIYGFLLGGIYALVSRRIF